MTMYYIFIKQNNAFVALLENASLSKNKNHCHDCTAYDRSQYQPRWLFRSHDQYLHVPSCSLPLLHKKSLKLLKILWLTWSYTYTPYEIVIVVVVCVIYLEEISN